MSSQALPSWKILALNSAVTAVIVLGAMLAASVWAENSELDSGPRLIPYNGVLEFNGQSFTGQADIQFTLTDDGGCNFTEDHEEVRVFAGRFSVNIGQPTGDLPPCLFDASAVFLEMGVRGADDDNPHVALAGRQRINPVPFSYWAAEGSDFRVDGLLRADSATIPTLNGNTTITGNAVINGDLRPRAGANGINFPDNFHGLGNGDDAFIDYINEGGENTALRIGVGNDPDDDLQFYQQGAIRMSVGSGNINLNLPVQASSSANITGALTAGSANVTGALTAGDIQGVSTINSGGAAFSTGGNLAVGGTLSATTVNAPIIPSYSNWNSQGTGSGGAAIYNDSDTYKALMVVGNNSGGGDRKVEVYDDLEVAGTINVSQCRICLNYGDSNGLYRAYSCVRMVPGESATRMNMVGTVDTSDSYHLSFVCDGGPTETVVGSWKP